MLTIVYTSGSRTSEGCDALSHRNFTHIVLNGCIILDEMLYQPNRLMMLSLTVGTASPAISNTWRLADKAWSAYLWAKHPARRSAVSNRRICWRATCSKCVQRCSQKAGAGIRMAGSRCKAVRSFCAMVQGRAGTGTSFDCGLEPSISSCPSSKSIRSALGPNLKYLACGGALLNVDPCPFFNGMMASPSLGVRYDGNRRSDDRQLAKCESRRFRW